MSDDNMSPTYKIRIIRLKYGPELIGQKSFADSDGNIYYKDIMKLGMVQGDNGMQFLHLVPWCPLSIYFDRVIPLNFRDILFEATPSNSLLKYYTDTIQKLDDTIKNHPDGFSKIMTWTDILKELENETSEGKEPTKPSDLN